VGEVHPSFRPHCRENVNHETRVWPPFGAKLARPVWIRQAHAESGLCSNLGTGHMT
jgi:hypothetical protein